LALSFILREGEQSPPDAGTLSRRVDGYAVKKKALVGYEQLQYTNNAALTLGNVDLTCPNDARVVL
jgi:hypothetical protein